jgi:adenylate kinase family enzyme
MLAPSSSARRILIFGATGSGKTTLSRRLGEALGLNVIELDALFWQPGWIETPTEEFAAKALAAMQAATDGWVCDGNYSRIRDRLLPLADTVIWLRLPWRVSYWRMLRRTIARYRRRELLWGTNRESLRGLLLSRDSLLWWGIHHHRAGQRSIARCLEQAPRTTSVIELRSGREVEALLQAAVAARSIAP